MNHEQLIKQYETIKARGKKLDMSRGKPSPEQLGTMSRLLTAVIRNDECFSETGTDCRNYGGLDGINEMKRLFGEILNVPMEQVIVGGNSSLNLMYDTVARAMLCGVREDCKPWCKYDQISFLCPVPGYDRHFAICELFGIRMINVPLLSDGPDMDLVEKLVAEDDTIKGIWCVPKYANPSGITYSDEVVRRFAQLKPAAKDFLVFWDNAYAVHELVDEEVPLADIFTLAEQYGNEDMVFYFASTSKITFPGSGVAIMAASERNLDQIRPILAKQTIGFDKINQMRHVKYFGSAAGIREHMKKHAAIMRPKFEIVDSIMHSELDGTGAAEWVNPKGGYFISLYVPDGCATAVYNEASKAGVALTKAGSTYPYGFDPRDRNLRIAPTYPSNDELRVATHVLCEAVKFAAAKKFFDLVN